jgi:predicted proteasome-type protease
MSYCTVMAVKNGIIMAADRRAMAGGNIASHTQKKLLVIGDTVAMTKGGNVRPLAELYYEKLSHEKKFNSPTEAAQEIINYFSENIDQYEKEEDAINNETNCIIAGYDKQKINVIGGGIPTPEIYYASTQKNTVLNISNYRFFFRGANEYFDQYVDEINKRIIAFNYTLQDAVNITKFAFDMSRTLGHYLDRQNSISEDIEMLSITPYGVEWVRKKELEYV